MRGGDAALPELLWNLLFGDVAEPTMAELVNARALGDDTVDDRSNRPRSPVAEAAVSGGRVAGIRRSVVLAHSAIADFDRQS